MKPGNLLALCAAFACTVASSQALANHDAAFVPVLEIEPDNAVLAPGEARSFGAKINYPAGVFYLRQPVKWQVVEANGGSISLSGLYTAPQTPGTYHVTAQREDFPGVSKTVNVTVSQAPSGEFVPTLSVQPASISVSAGAVVTFTAALNYPVGVNYIRQPVSWSVLENNGGTITPNGLYTAPQQAGLYHVKAQREDRPERAVVVEVLVK